MIPGLSLVTGNIWRTVAIAALAIAAMQTVRIEGLWFIDGLQDKLADAREQVKAERTAHIQTIENYRKAQAEAVARATAEKQAVEARHSALREKADDDLALAQERARSASERYVSANRCVRAEAPRTAGSDRGGPDLPRPPGSAGSAAGADNAAELVAVSRPDFDTCTANSLRLKAAQDWAKGL